MPVNTTSTISQNLTPTEPSLRDLLDLFKKDILLSLHSHHIGTIQSFNATNQTATATINYNKTYFEFNASNNTYIPVLVNYPILADCPVICLGGAQGALTFPIAKGDECLILFNDRDLDNWFSGGTGAPNATARLHSFSDGIILVGVRSLPHVLSNYDTSNVILKNGANSNAKIGTTEASLNYGSTSQVQVNASESILSYQNANCTTNDMSAALNYENSQVTVSDKITISNSDADLVTILNNLTSVLTSVVNALITASIISAPAGAVLLATLTTTSTDIGDLFE